MPFSLTTLLKRFFHWCTRPLGRYFDKLRRHPFAGTLLLLLVFLPALILLTFAVVLPVLKNPYEQSRAVATEEEAKSAAEATAPADSAVNAGSRNAIVDLETSIAFWQARLQLAKSDSIGLVVNLRDSLVSLEVKGVPMRVCRIENYYVGSALQRLRAQGRLPSWLATPFTLQGGLATLPKAPVRIVEAPADTIEAQKRSALDIPIEKRDVHYTLEFDRDLVIAIEQTQAPTFKGWWEKLRYKSRRLLASAHEAVDSLAQDKLPRHRMLIEMELAQEDARAIYRALPYRASMVLYF